jgi:hypothetical protein
MAGNGGVQMDQQAHAKTYSGFLTMLKIGTAITVITTAVVIFLIAN